jgi:DNA-directed RNA polymerase I subunit RPA43
LDEEREAELLGSEKANRNGGRDGAGRRLGGSKALGATSLGVPAEPEEDADNGLKKHRTRY